MKKRLLSVIAVIAMILGCFSGSVAFASEPDESSVITSGSTVATGVQPRAGEETLPLGWYLIEQHFTITNNNLTKVKTVQGRYLTLDFSWMVSTEDKGIGGEYLTIKIKDASTGQYISGLVATDGVEDKWQLRTFQHTFDLGWAGRKIQIFTDVSSLGQSNGYYRAADFYDYMSYVYN